ncbi:MAG TPA: hypothetical protein VNG31_00665 [Candidatus Baltobacteraceae bacterium]|nr:hypothetical protein [Candidatus Baltobacteraceae bacterium]
MVFSFRHSRSLIRSAAFLSCVIGLVLANGPARASGTVSIQQSDGSVNSYSDVGIKVIRGALYLTTADGKGTLVINRAACAYQREIFVCLPTSVTLVQAGSAKPLDLATGTVYANRTDQPQPLALSSKRLPPHSILLSISTDRGTYISLSGTIDKVTK